ncbi:MAG TPA: polymer-forming cytoskeletal protein [Spirochaetia bacterium]|nr:polymer-forming cytoskeletal protein [Spirochaetia bacterium]
MAEVRIKDIDEHEIDTILAEDIDFEGRLTFKKPLMIKGKFKGEIKSTSALYIGEKAYVEATTEADIVSSKGRHKGDILGHSRVELFSTARVDGDIATPDFVVESGCKFNGNCSMSGEAARKEAPAQPSAGIPAAAPAQQPRSPEQPRPSGQPGQQRPDAAQHRPAVPGQQPQQQPQQQRSPTQPGSGGGQGGGQK